MIRLRYFQPYEFNYPDNMDENFLRMLDDIRSDIEMPIRIIGDYATSGHAPNSYHYKGRAVDFIPIGINYLTIASAIFVSAKKRGMIIGLGLYPHWSIKGLHLDNGIRKGRSTYWYRDKKGKYHYDYDFYNIIRKLKC